MSTGSEIIEKVFEGDPGSIEISGKTGPELVTGSSSTKEGQNQRAAYTGASTADVHPQSRVSGWNPEYFAQQQIESLVQRVFFPGWPRPARQVVFAAVDNLANAGRACAQVSVAMAQRLPGTVCAIEADRQGTALERAFLESQRPAIVGRKKEVKDGQRLQQQNLCLLSASEFFAAQNSSAAWLRNRLSELRREFDYIVIHCPAVATCSETALVGQMADGVILVLDQQRTRRAAAREAKQVLQTANARLLGVVLSERVFPIPESIYSRL